MRFPFIAAEKANYPIVALCRNLEVTRAGFYAWRRRPVPKRAQRNAAALVHIRAVHRRSRQRYGSPRVHRQLQENGVAIGLHRVARLMRLDGLRGRMKRRFRVTTDSNHNLRVAPNLVARQFDVARPNRVWLSDITYLATAEGWLYLSAVLDLHSRRLVGWSLDDHLEASGACRALRQAIAARRPRPGLIVHSDRGVQYAGNDYQRILRAHRLQCSMSRKGDCWDNAPMESFFGSLKRELDQQKPWPTMRAAEDDVGQFIRFYNYERLHSALDYRSPARYEMKAVS
jgi:putative transposase